MAHGDKYNTGTELVRRLIDDQFQCSIYISYGDSFAIPISREKASTTGTGGIINYNPSNSASYALVEYTDENGDVHVTSEKFPSEIALGHELIHVLRYMGGNNIPENQMGRYLYRDRDGWFGRRGKVINTTARMEELATTGISYTRSNDGSWANAGEWKMTENALRAEHGYRRRVKY